MNSRVLVMGAVILAIGFLVFSRFTSSTASNVTASIHNSAVAPDFSLQKLGGGTITLSEFRGKKPVIVDFWASWCPNCRRDMPNLNSFYEKYKDKVEVIGVNLREGEGAVKAFISSRGIAFPIALDPYGRAANDFGIQYTNTHFLIDIDGNLVRTVPGDIRESDIVGLIEQGS